MNRKVALITGITGQDGSYLAELLLEKGYDVHGTIRRSSTDYRERIAHLEGTPNFHLHYADLGDSMSIIQVMNKVKPTEVYNLAAQSHVQVSFDSPEFTADVDATGVLRILEAIRQCGLEKTCRMYQASTSELYGKVEEVPQNENTPFHPYSPYAVAKQYGFWIVKEYREAYNMFCCSGILFNHESERRGETFVTRKITLAAARIKQGKQSKLYLGNLDSLRDWGYAKDYVECMWLILQAEKPEDFVIATGKQHSVREFAQLAFHHVGIDLKWEGKNENTPFHPYSPYAVAKQYGFWIVKEYREAYDMFCCSGILFNHESERRGETFVTRKITLAAARIKQGKQDKLYLGNLDSLRDWGYAKDYVECMWLILQAEKPEDFVIATGKQHSVREFAQLAFHYVGIELKWEGKDENEKGICVEGPEELIGKTLVEVSPDFYRPTDVVNLWGDPTKAKAKLNWNPNTTSFEDLVKIMVESDMAKVAAEDAGQKVRCNLAEYLEKGIVK